MIICNLSHACYCDGIMHSESYPLQLAAEGEMYYIHNYNIKWYVIIMHAALK